MPTILDTLISALKAKNTTTTEEVVSAVLHQKLQEQLSRERKAIAQNLLSEGFGDKKEVKVYDKDRKKVLATVNQSTRSIGAAKAAGGQAAEYARVNGEYAWVLKEAPEFKKITIPPTHPESKGLASLYPTNWDKGFDAGWGVGNGGTEQPFLYNGKWFLYVYNRRTGKHAYYSYKDDMYLSDYKTGELAEDWKPGSSSGFLQDLPKSDNKMGKQFEVKCGNCGKVYHITGVGLPNAKCPKCGKHDIASKKLVEDGFDEYAFGEDTNPMNQYEHCGDPWEEPNETSLHETKVNGLTPFSILRDIEDAIGRKLESNAKVEKLHEGTKYYVTKPTSSIAYHKYLKQDGKTWQDTPLGRGKWEKDEAERLAKENGGKARTTFNEAVFGSREPNETALHETRVNGLTPFKITFKPTKNSPRELSWTRYAKTWEQARKDAIKALKNEFPQAVIIDINYQDERDFYSEALHMPQHEVQRIYDQTGDRKETELLCGVSKLVVNQNGEVVSYISEGLGDVHLWEVVATIYDDDKIQACITAAGRNPDVTQHTGVTKLTWLAKDTAKMNTLVRKLRSVLSASSVIAYGTSKLYYDKYRKV